MHLLPWTAASIKRLSVILIALAMWAPSSLFAQTNPQPPDQESPALRVPFVGCGSDGQVGPVAAPTGAEKVVRIEASAAQKLAYYKAEIGPGVLAPRGWYCLGTYGSSGSSLFVIPQPINRNDRFSTTGGGITGPVIRVSQMLGGTSGRFAVAGIIARIFPGQKAFVQSVIKEGIAAASDFPSGPYPKDKLILQSDRIVEFQTPPHSEGLGTLNSLQANNYPINGVAILKGQAPDLLHLRVRLPAGLNDLTSQIIQQFARDNAESLPGK